HPTLLPIVPALGLYKNIKPNLPNFLNDQLRPALSFADDADFSQRVLALKERLSSGTHADDSLMQLAAALLPLVAGTNLQPTANPLPIHDGPLLRDYTTTPSRSLPLCQSFKDAIDTLISLEALLPRILWTRWLTATLRLWLPLFFLKRCAVTSTAAESVKSVLATNIVPAPAEMSSTLFGANGILRGSKEWLNQLTPIIQSYVRARFEISILLELSNLHERLAAHGIDPTNPAHAQRIVRELSPYEVNPASATNTQLPDAEGICASGRLSMPDDTGSSRLPFDIWLTWIATNRPSLDALAKIIGAEDVPNLVERVYAYIRPDYEPLRSGFGKNAYEYVAFALGAPRKA